MLRALAEVHPQSMNRVELGQAAGMSSESGTFDTYMSKLRSLELASGRGDIRASDELFN